MFSELFGNVGIHIYRYEEVCVCVWGGRGGAHVAIVFVPVTVMFFSQKLEHCKKNAQMFSYCSPQGRRL